MFYKAICTAASRKTMQKTDRELNTTVIVILNVSNGVRIFSLF